MRLRRLIFYLFVTPWLIWPDMASAATGADIDEWVSGAGHRYASLQVNGAGREGFVRLSPTDTGVTFTNHLPEQRFLANQILANGSGVTAGDVDGDGWCDLFLCGLGSGSKLFRNLGQWKFQDVTASAGVTCANLDATGAAFADLDGDGDMDLVVNSVGSGTYLFVNEGSGRFTKMPEPLNSKRGGMSSAIADIDGDGDLDLYIANYRTITIRDQPQTRFSVKMVDGKPVVAAINGRSVADPDLVDRFVFKFRMENGRGTFAHEENGEPDALYLNEGAGRFRLVSLSGDRFLDEEGQALAKPPLDWGLSVMFRDIDSDGAPDIYVCNDFWTPDRIWMNDGHGRFRAIARSQITRTSLSSMAVDFADLNRDGLDEFFVADMLSPNHQRRLVQRNMARGSLAARSTGRPQHERNTLFLNRGDGTYAEVAQYCGLEASEWSWTSLFLDVDLDGYEDLLVANGFERDNMNLDALKRIDAAKAAKKLSPLEEAHLKKLFPRLATPNLAFRNLGVLRFEEVGAKWGFNAAEISQGMCLADLDNDGDLDVVMNNMNGAAGLYRNSSGAPRVAVKLKGLAPNTRGIGAKIRVYGGAVPMQSQEMICGGRYLSSDDPMRVFAAGSLTNAMRIEVSWRNGKRSVVDGVMANRIYEIDEAGSEKVPDSELRIPNSEPQPVYEDVSRLIPHTHHEEDFNDFARQPLLPRKLSQLGPAVAWHDLNGDGRVDLVIGSGKGGKPAVFRNDGSGGFERLSQEPLDQVATADQTGIVGFGKGKILVGLANYEDGLALGSSVRGFDLTAKRIEDVAPGAEASVGPLAMGDVDGDGELDLFVGGRGGGGKYPDHASSRIYRSKEGLWQADEINRKALEQVGLVSGALWSDLDGDGWPELVLACEWGPIRVFGNRRGELVEHTKEWGLSDYTGLWTGVTAGDLNGDGRLELIAANWGRNSQYESRRTKPIRMYFGDLDGNGTTDLVESYYHPEMKKYVPEQGFEVLSRALPFLFDRFRTHQEYAEGGIDQILGERLKNAKHCEVNWLESTVFFNRGNHFQAQAMPAEAQLAPAFAVCVGDFDGDGREDVFLSQNFLAVAPDTSPYDAGRGLWMRGDGMGGLKPVPGQESGVKVYGEQRGAALSDYDGDGRVDLVVTQNGAETKLFRNTGGKPGLRVRLKGTEGNADGVGALLRLKFGAAMGPVREIHAGSGYWSQDGSVAVLGHDGVPTQLWVRWPGGKEVSYALPPQCAELEVSSSGELRLVK